MGAIEGLTAVATVASTSKAPAKAQTGRDLAKGFGCMACYAIDTRIVGPAFRDIAARYGSAGARPAEAQPVAKVKSGGSGAWGDTSMPAQPQVGAADSRTIVQWILAGAR